MNPLLVLIPLMAASVVAADTTSSGPVATEQDKSETGSAVDLDSVKDTELPKQVEVTEAVKVRLLNERGGGGVVSLPAGAKVEVTGRSGNMLSIVFAKSAGQIDIAKTTAFEEIAKIRAANKVA